MAMFTKSLEKTLIRDCDVAKANVDRLAGKISDAEQAVIAAKSLAQRLALSGDDGGLDAAETAGRSAVARLDTLKAALTEAEKLSTLLESQLAAVMDKKMRAATAVEVEALADELVQAGQSFDIGVSALADVAARVAMIAPESNGLAIFAGSAQTEVGLAIEVITRLVREHGRLVLAGEAPPMLPKPEVIAVPVKVVAPVTTRVFSMKAIHWSTSEGTRFVAKYKQVDLSPAMAARALKIGACVTMESVACKTFHGSHVPASGNLADSDSLDDDAAAERAPPAPESQHEKVVHTAFERVDRGPSFKLRVAAGVA